jgi:hypothetical protein
MPANYDQTMTTGPNGREDGLPSQRVRHDHQVSAVVRTHDRSSSAFSADHSGRRLVLTAGAVMLVLWASLYLVFRDWRARYRARASYGAVQVAPVIDQLAEIIPPGVNPSTWREAVRQTHVMLVTVTSSNLLDLPQMQSLRAELQQTVARAQARPETACEELAAVWNTMADRAEFIFRDGRSANGERHPRPKILPPRPAKEKAQNKAISLSRPT